MKILICGAGKGSWIMRGQQLGAALGARVTSSPTDDDFHWCDLVILVKKHATTFAPRAHKHGKPIVWDALDFWSQPAHNHYKADAATLALQSHIRVIKPALVIGATDAMAAAARNFCRAEYLPHHSWAGLVPTQPRERVEVVAYEGNPMYLGRWHGWLTEACDKRGWKFVVNPENLADADIIVAFRDGVWDGWICREWKSNVKLVNAMAAGRPFICQNIAPVRDIGYHARIIELAGQLDAALDAEGSAHARAVAFDHRDRGDFTVNAVAARYLDILKTVEVPCATA